jgi:hypothetical protein
LNTSVSAAEMIVGADAKTADGGISIITFDQE